ncbi:MAG: hypothetical protein E4H47_00215 [Parcubacteria group bacterium]|nr:MAG: hypothetical protein E4H47_00215 [Parcubacteria group bacterium]
MVYDFYNSKDYKRKQSNITKENWKKGIFNFHFKREKKKCARKECERVFEVIRSSPKIYCSKSCATKVNNVERGPHSEEVKLKLSKALKGRKNPYDGLKKVARIKVVCMNPRCRKVFLMERWMSRKFCSNKCAMEVIGGKPTSPKAARGKAGIRKDISKAIYFYSRWEANIARLFNYLGIKWVHQARIFDLGSQNYTPDFYLPAHNLYVEVKNFLWKYSEIRDRKFRALYPNIRLSLLLKKDYLKLENKYSKLIKNWKYRIVLFRKHRHLTSLV